MNRRACLALMLLASLACAGVRRDPLGGARQADAGGGDGPTVGDPADGSNPPGPDGSFTSDTAPDVPVMEPDSGTGDGSSDPADAPITADVEPPVDTSPRLGDAGPGQTCTLGEDCLSGHCARGVCCDEPCTGPCDFCLAPGSEGVCQHITSNLAPGCSGDHACDATGACKLAPGATCNTNAECTSGQCRTQRCCRELCPHPSDACDAIGSCRPTGGAMCSRDEQCLSSFCVDGRCCGVRDCPGDCRLCLGSGGICSSFLNASVPEIQCGLRNACYLDACRFTVGHECSTPDQCMGGRCDERKCSCALCFGFPAPVNPNLNLEILSFGSLPIGGLTTVPAILRNRGSTAQVIGPPLVSGPDSLSVPRDSCAGTTLAPDATCVLDLQFAPSTPGPAVATLFLLTDQGALAAAMSLHGDGVEANAARMSPSFQNLGKVAIGSTSAATIVILNPADGVAQPIGLPVLLGRNPDQFVVTTFDCLPTLEPGQQCKIQATFRPTAPGVQLATLVMLGATASLIGFGL